MAQKHFGGFDVGAEKAPPTRDLRDEEIDRIAAEILAEQQAKRNAAELRQREEEERIVREQAERDRVRAEAEARRHAREQAQEEALARQAEAEQAHRMAAQAAEREKAEAEARAERAFALPEEPKKSAEEPHAPSLPQQLEDDEDFRRFFSTTVAVVPPKNRTGEQEKAFRTGAMAADAEGDDGAPAKQKRSLGKLLSRLFHRSEEEDDDLGVMLPGQKPELSAQENTGEVPLWGDAADDTQPIDLNLRAWQDTAEVPPVGPEQSNASRAATPKERELEQTGTIALTPDTPDVLTGRIVFLRAEETPPADVADDIAAAAIFTDAANIVTDEPTGEINLTPVSEPVPDDETADTVDIAAAAVVTDEPTGKINLTPVFEPAPDDETADTVDIVAAAVVTDEPTGEISLSVTDETENSPAAPVRSKFDSMRLFGVGEDESPEAADASATAQPSPFAAPEEPEPEAVLDDYESPEDAESVAASLKSMTAGLTLRCVLTGIFAAALLILGLMAQGVLPAVPGLEIETVPTLFLGVALVLLGISAALSYPVMRDGFVGLFKRRSPSPDTLPALSAAAAVLQLAVCLFAGSAFDASKTTLFASMAGLLLFADALGSRLMSTVIAGNFELVTAGVEHAAAYRLKDAKLAARLAAGMEEEAPQLMLNRPAALVKGFLAQSFSPRKSDKNAQKLAWLLLGAAVLAMGITLVRSKSLVAGISALAGVLCFGAPLSATLLAAVPSLLMQRAAARVGAVVPGWYGIEELGKIDLVTVDAKDLFPPACAKLCGIKTFRKERIDLAILYATSVLIAGCNTLSGLFSSMIENKLEMLYEVKDLEKRPGLGFTAWCDNCRILLGTRELLTQEGVELPALDYENRYTKDGERQVLYLAVSGQLYAMFLLSYAGEKNAARTLSVLKRENIRLLVTADDPSLTAGRIEKAYHLRPGFVKVLSSDERHALEPATAYLAASEGCMIHLGSFASFVGGLKAAAGAADAERSACTLQTVSVLLAAAVGLFLGVSGGIPGLPLAAVVLYQLAWSALTLGITLTRKY